MSGSLNVLTTDLFKIANDIRLLGSGPRSGLGELNLPENEPGSSIMPGKVNPTQCEALTMVCVQAMGMHNTISLAGSQGHFELNAYKPVIGHNIIELIHLLSSGMDNFNDKCLKGIKPNLKNIKSGLENSLMLVTALAPEIGYSKAADLAKLAHKKNISLVEANKILKYMDSKKIKLVLDPKKNDLTLIIVMSSPNKHTVLINGHNTSVFVEDDFWIELKKLVTKKKYH